jgi:sulfopyruvate decarboxylase subunit beta
MMKRDDFLKTLARHRKEEVVVAVYSAAQELLQIGPHPLNYTFTGAMGQGSSHALGIALGRPDKRVIILDGDGSLLMNLGSLVTIAHAAPGNLIHCLCRNNTYETNGSISIPNRGKLSFTAMAMAAGYRRAVTITTLEEWERQLPGLLTEQGPVFVDIEMQKGASYKEDFVRLYNPTYRDAFRRALAEST